MDAALAEPAWPYCGAGTDPSAGGPFGCRGRSVDPYTACLAHLTDEQLETHLAGLGPGSDLDHRGTVLDEDLLNRLLAPLVVTVRRLRSVRVGRADFRAATFKGVVRFDSAVFHGDALFDSAAFHDEAFFGSATFKRDARFGSAVFARDVRFRSAAFQRFARFGSVVFGSGVGFRSATFAREARFDSAAFDGPAHFDSAAFSSVADFESAVFSSGARFDSVAFTRAAWFRSATFDGMADFGRARFDGGASFGSAAFHAHGSFAQAVFEDTADFENAAFHDVAAFSRAVFRRGSGSRLGPFVCAKKLSLSSASFEGPVTIDVSARQVVCDGTHWSSAATMRLRSAGVDLTEAVIDETLRIAAHRTPFSLHGGGEVDESLLSGLSPAVRMLSLDGVDAARLALTDVDISGCPPTGVVHMDQLRLDGRRFFVQVRFGMRVREVRRPGRPWRWWPRRR
ncbi:pentapeptide repeat-containing protein [Streptomyces sp. MMS24-I29]|uniref:pentapeptide repeat-containing protein n=1 Tax=Streptomyces sp. MMS24-I29 TaxID=3351480 RepID=UPI003C7E84C2